MSPEQVQCRDLGPRSDLYSLGAVMYEMLTGHRPFRAGALGKLLHQIVYATPSRCAICDPSCPRTSRAGAPRAREGARTPVIETAPSSRRT